LPLNYRQAIPECPFRSIDLLLDLLYYLSDERKRAAAEFSLLIPQVDCLTGILQAAESFRFTFRKDQEFPC
jgi:hypothetical protein